MGTKGDKGEPASLWVIRGAPGVGKSAAARSIRKRLPSCAVIEVDTLRGMRGSPDWKDTESHLLGLEQAARLARSFIRNGVAPVIVVDTMMADRLAYFEDQAGRRCKVFMFVVAEDELRRRVRSREAGFRDEATILKMARAIRASPVKGEVVVDTSRLSPEAAAAMVVLMGNGC